MGFLINDIPTSLIRRVVRKILRQILVAIIQLKYSVYNFFSRKKGITEKKRHTKIILSLTSYPSRIHLVYLTIESLLRQVVKPDKIYLWLSLEEFPDKKIPKKLERLKKRGLEVRFNKENLRSFKKLIPSLFYNPLDNIITVDDDILYPTWFLQKMILEHKRQPKDVLCFRANLIKIKEGNLEPYQTWMNYSQKIKRSKNLIPTGCSGIFYPSFSINQEVFNKKVYQTICNDADDIWFKAMTLLNGRYCQRIGDVNLKFLEIKGSQKEALFKSNVNKRKNDEKAKSVFEKYKLIKLIN